MPWVPVEIPQQDLPGYKAPRVACADLRRGGQLRARGGSRRPNALPRRAPAKRYYRPL